MPQTKIKIFAISGSLRSNSSASAVLRVVVNLVPNDVDFNIFPALGEIPPFDDSDKVPLPVTNFISRVTEADAVFFCVPEYAFGVPGALKNALDWTVSSTAFSDKPVALITAASSGDKAHASLLLTLSAIGAKVPEGATLLISFVRSKMDENNEVKDISTLNMIKKVVETLIKAIEEDSLSIQNEAFPEPEA